MQYRRTFITSTSWLKPYYTCRKGLHKKCFCSWARAADPNTGIAGSCSVLRSSNTRVLHLTFGYHPPGINGAILVCLETLWDRLKSLQSFRAALEDESSAARLFNWDNVPISGGHIHLCLYCFHHSLVNEAAADFPPMEESVSAPSFSDILRQGLSVFVWDRSGRWYWPMQLVPIRKASQARVPIKTNDGVLIWTDITFNIFLTGVSVTCKCLHLQVPYFWQYKVHLKFRV